MLDVSYYSSDGVEKQKVSLPENLFGKEVREAPVHYYVKGYLRNQRQGTVDTLQRNSVRGGGIKPWRQKGTGRARAGTISSPVWVGGGRAFRPHPHDHYRKIPKKLKHAALISALSSKASDGKIQVFDVPALDVPKTGSVASMLNKMGLMENKVLILLTEKNDNFILSCRNLKNVECLRTSLVNAYKLSWADNVLLSSDSLKVLEEVFGK